MNRLSTAIGRLSPMQRMCCCIGLILTLTAPGSATVGDPTIQTAHPIYPGEGAFQTVEQCVAFATKGQKTDQDRAIALYLWLLTHQYHAASPQEWCVPGRTPNAARDDQEQTVYDANRARFSYGYGLCGTVHAWNEPYWRALGFGVRRRAFPGHTNSEVQYGGSWHAFDTDMAGLVFRRDGVVAGYDDIRKDPTLVDLDRWPLPRYPFAWPTDFRIMKKGWEQIAKGGNWYCLYHGGYAAHPGIVHLRAGETFTRYYHRDHFGGPEQRRFWYVGKGGPFRDWTFVNAGQPRHEGAKSNSRGNASYCNGEFDYQPDLGQPRYREGVVAQSDNLASGGDGQTRPRLYSRDGAACSVTFAHFSPYVIAGCPADGVNPMTGPASGGLVVRGEAVGSVRLDVSADGGQTWQDGGELRGAFERDLTDLVKGRYGWQLRFRWQGPDGLNRLRFTTVTQVAQTIYPRLTANGCEVVYRCASRGVVPVLPHFGADEATVVNFAEVKPLRSANMRYMGRDPKQRFAYLVQGPKAGKVVFRVEAPAPLLEVVAAARFNVRVPPPPKHDYRLELSTDAGQSWREMARVSIPPDNEYSSAWMAGSRNVEAANTKQAYVAVHLDGGGTQVGLITSELYGVYRTPPPSATRLTITWKEGNVRRTHTESIPANTAEWKFRVPTGQQVADESIRLEAL
jgi:hypothetical protein